MSFVHLQCHTEYSLLEGAIRVPELIARCAEWGMSAVALTDNGTMHGVIEFYLAAKAKGIRPIIGCEMYITPDITVKERGLNRLVLLCKDYEGYQNLIHLVTVSHLEGFYYKPRIDFAHLANHTRGLIAISPGMRGPVGYPLRSNQIEEAKQAATALKAMYGSDFYLGLQKLDFPMEDLVNESSAVLGQELGIPLVVTNDVYYLNKEEAFLRDVLHCIQTGKLLQEDLTKLQSQELYFKSFEDIQGVFAQYPEAVANTVNIAEQCHLEIETEQVKLPHFECPGGKTSEAYLEELVWEGIRLKYAQVTPEIEKRVEYELNVIKPMHYAPYFLIIYDFLKFCNDSHIPVGPGRGSAAGSIVAYALDITKIDPLPYNLLFERFLNPERVSMPDIDLDFCIRRRGEVIDYIVKRYGADHVSQIATFGTMAARGVIRDVGRVLNIPLSDVDRMAKLIPSSPGSYTSIPEALEQVSDLKKLYDSSEELKRLLDIGARLEGFSRHTSTHAAGVVISRDPLSTVVPLAKNEGQIVTQFSMTDLEKVGLLKMDILGLRNLTVMDDAVKMIHNLRGVTIELGALPLSDEKSYDLLCSGNTMGVFQLEGRGMRQLIKDMKPRVFEDVIALLALYRPGPLGSGMVSEFISNKSGKTEVKYDLPALEPILKDTYGMIVYQEQVMQIASVVAGFTLGQSDMLRRAMGKKKKEEMDKLKDKFIEGANERGVPVEKSTRIFDLCYKFAEYGFNKSHSAAYALISFQTAYLKANYPVEYMAALLSSILGSSERVSGYIQECKALGINVLPPDVNESGISFTIVKEDDKNAIRFGLGAIKNVGEGAIESLIQNRDSGPYTSLLDLCKRVDLRQVNKRVIESLIKSGACDLFGNRAQLLSVYEAVLERAQALAKEKQTGQMGLFAFAQEEEDAQFQNRDYVYMPETEKLKMEKEMLGLYISGHPLDALQDKLLKLPHNTEVLKPEDEGKSVMLLGFLTDCRRVMTRNKKEMLIGALEDRFGSLPVVMFYSDKFDDYAPHFKDDTIVQVKGRVRVNQDEISLSCDSIEPVDPFSKAHKLYIDTENIDDMTVFEKLKQVVVHNKGPLPLYFIFPDSTVVAHVKFGVSDSSKCLNQIESIVGMGHCWLG